MAIRKTKVFFRMGEAEKEKVTKIAEGRGLNFSEGVREALEWYAGLSDGYIKMVRAFSGSFSVPVPVVIENLGLETIARETAEDKVKGGPSPIEVFPKQLNGEPITGFEFLNMREATWKAHYQQKLAEQAAQEQYLAEQAAQKQEGQAG